MLPPGVIPLFTLAATMAAAAPVELSGHGWRVAIEPSTLEFRIAAGDPAGFTLSAGQQDLGSAAGLRQTATSAAWTLPARGIQIAARLDETGFSIELTSDRAQSFTWPVMRDDAAIKAYILPKAEGFFVPPREAGWREFLLSESPLDTMEALSMPFWGVDYGGRTATFVLTNPFDNELAFDPDGDGVRLALTHRFQRNQEVKRYGVLIRTGGGSPVEPAKQYRRWIEDRGEFVSMRRKIECVPEAAKLPGAPHVYLWGDGVSPAMVESLKAGGFDRLWLGADRLDGLPMLRETVESARKAGFLIGVYDSYHSIHPPGLRDSWQTAQFDRKLFEEGSIVQENGKKDRGFRGVGHHLSSLAARPYVEKRVRGAMRKAPFNSYFVDCDATGELFDNYSPLYPATKEADMKARLERLAWIRDTFGAVVGSEGGAFFAAPAIHFAHGMMTPVFGYRDPVFTEPASPSFFGRWYPDTGPKRFMKRIPVPEKYRTIYFDPRYRLPLYQAAFHDSIVTTHHWEYGSFKFGNVLDTDELLELLYGVPPLYHLNTAEFARNKTQIAQHYRLFSPLHRELALLPMTDFAWLTEDRLVQRTVFGERVEIVANFTGQAFEYRGERVPADGIFVYRRDGKKAVTYRSAWAK